MLKHDKITINISYRNITHYKKLGYEAYLHQPLDINTTDLTSVSHTKVDAICAICDKVVNLNYCKYLRNVDVCGYYGCKTCSHLKRKIIKNKITNHILLKKALGKVDSIEINKSEDNYTNLVYDENYQLYRNEVRRLTKKSYKKLLETWDGNDYYDGEYIKDNFKLSHIDNKYPSIDHKTSVYYGYTNGIDPSDIADISNICMTKRFINSTKRDANNFLG